MPRRDVRHLDSQLHPPVLGRLDRAGRREIGNQVAQSHRRSIGCEIGDVQQVIRSRRTLDLQAVGCGAAGGQRVQDLVEPADDDRVSGQLQVQGNEPLIAAVYGILPFDANPAVRQPILVVRVENPRVFHVLLVHAAPLVPLAGQRGKRRATLIDPV